MNQMLQRINVFISSPSDVQPEREIALRVIDRLNRLAYINQRCILRALAYEEVVPPSVGDSPQDVVDHYMMKSQDCDILICILWQRMGTPVVHEASGQRYDSGTAYEFITAYEANQTTGKPYILLYRRAGETSDHDPEQKAKVDAFFKQFEGQDSAFKGLYKTYQTLPDFEEMLLQHIEQVIVDNALLDTAPQGVELHEEARRLDAAMPGQVSDQTDTEIWVQLCMPESQGFREQLPVQITSGDVIARKDVRAGTVGVRFPVDSSTGKLQPARLRIDINTSADFFSFGALYQYVSLSPGKDSGLILFRLRAKRAAKRSVVHITVKQELPDETVVTLGSVALATEIVPTGVRLAAKIVWSVLSLPLATLMPEATKQTPLERADMPSIDIPTVSDEDREEIEKSLFLDENLLYTLLPPYVKSSFFNFGGQRSHGQEIFETLMPQLRTTLCDEWGLCQKLNHPVFDDEFALTIVIADIIAPAVTDLPPYLIAALIVKMGVRTFCQC